VTVLDSGNVGIGTASPGAKLDVVVATTQALRVERGNGGTIGQFVGSGYSTTLDIQDNVGSVLLLKSAREIFLVYQLTVQLLIWQ